MGRPPAENIPAHIARRRLSRRRSGLRHRPHRLPAFRRWRLRHPHFSPLGHEFPRWLGANNGTRAPHSDLRIDCGLSDCVVALENRRTANCSRPENICGSNREGRNSGRVGHTKNVSGVALGTGNELSFPFVGRRTVGPKGARPIPPILAPAFNRRRSSGAVQSITSRRWMWRRSSPGSVGRQPDC